MIRISYIYRKVVFFFSSIFLCSKTAKKDPNFVHILFLLGICLLASVIILSVTLVAYISTLISLNKLQSLSLISRDKDW